MLVLLNCVFWTFFILGAWVATKFEGGRMGEKKVRIRYNEQTKGMGVETISEPRESMAVAVRDGRILVRSGITWRVKIYEARRLVYEISRPWQHGQALREMAWPPYGKAFPED
jgi:hypothetical protein